MINKKSKIIDQQTVSVGNGKIYYIYIKEVNHMDSVTYKVTVMWEYPEASMPTLIAFDEHFGTLPAARCVADRLYGKIRFDEKDPFDDV